MKIAVSGKGGVGKTTLSALLAQAFADRGREEVGAPLARATFGILPAVAPRQPHLMNR